MHTGNQDFLLAKLFLLVLSGALFYLYYSYAPRLIIFFQERKQTIPTEVDFLHSRSILILAAIPLLVVILLILFF